MPTKKQTKEFIDNRVRLTFLVVLKSGGDYIPDNAIALAYQVRRNLHLPHRFVCLTDMEIDDPLVTTLPLKHGWPGWWSVVEMFRLACPVIATGLDTLIIDSIDRAGELALTCPPDTFYMTRSQPRWLAKGHKYCSGMMMWNGDWSWIYRNFKPEYMKAFRGEEDYTTAQLIQRELTGEIKVRLFQDDFAGFYSYKNDVRGKSIPEDAKIVAFHGHPRPHHCQEQWVQDVYNDRTYNHPWDEYYDKK